MLAFKDKLFSSNLVSTNFISFYYSQNIIEINPRTKSEYHLPNFGALCSSILDNPGMVGTNGCFRSCNFIWWQYLHSIFKIKPITVSGRQSGDLQGISRGEGRAEGCVSKWWKSHTFTAFALNNDDVTHYIPESSALYYSCQGWVLIVCYN